MKINRQRWLPPTDFTDRVFGSLPAPVRVTMAGLRLYVDDEGRAEVRLRRMLAEIYEHDETVTTQDLEGHLLRLDDVDWLRLYVDRHRRSLLQIRFWPAVQHPEPSLFDPPEGFVKPSRRSQETFTVEERESEEVRVGGPGVRPSRTNYDAGSLEPPSPFCSQHQPWGTEEKCGPCGTARMAREIWDRAAARVALPRPSSHTRSEEGSPESVEYLTGDGHIETT